MKVTHSELDIFDWSKEDAFADFVKNVIKLPLRSIIYAHTISSKFPIHKYLYENVRPGENFVVYESNNWKYTTNGKDYHCFFGKNSGFNLRYGKTLKDDPAFCALGPEILDLEISVNGCIAIPGSTNCRYCYKGNTTKAPTNMTFDTFKEIISRFPKNLSQIAFGITGLTTNPDMEKMFAYCRENGIIPNVTTVGADLTDEMLNVLCKYCGAVAVSCYTGAKQHCYDTIKKIKDWAAEKFDRDLHVNMHIVVSKDNMNHVREVLNDIKDGKVPGLKSVVLLRIKPKGRACHMDCTVNKDIYRELVNFCLNNNISFGFDSCSATPVMDVLKEIGMDELCDSAEPCESGLFSSYINVKGQYWNCSFAEGLTNFIQPINVLDYEYVTDWWNGTELDKVRNNESPACKSCPIYNLDGDE